MIQKKHQKTSKKTSQNFMVKFVTLDVLKNEIGLDKLRGKNTLII